MRTFTYHPAMTAPDEVAAAAMHPGAPDQHGDGASVFLAGDVTLLGLTKLDVSRPAALVDIGQANQDPSCVEATPAGLRIGALTKMAEVADHPDVLRDYPVVVCVMP